MEGAAGCDGSSGEQRGRAAGGSSKGTSGKALTLGLGSSRYAAGCPLELGLWGVLAGEYRADGAVWQNGRVSCRGSRGDVRKILSQPDAMLL